MSPPSSPSKAKFQTPGVVFQPETTRGLQNGINQLINAIRPTLGPLPRLVGIERIWPGKPPELLDSGGTIARRLLQLPDRDADMGAMFARHMLWKLQDKVGDGTATAGVIFQEIFNGGVRYLSAGGNAMQLRAWLEEGLRLVLEKLNQMARPIRGKEKLAELAESLCHDPELAQFLGDILDTVGAFGRIEIRNSRGRSHRLEWVQGIYWEGGALSPQMLLDPLAGRTVIEEGAILITDLEVDDPEDTLHVLELAVQAGVPGLLLLVKSLSDRAMAPLLNPHNWEKVKVVAVKTPGFAKETNLEAMTDLALLTGGRPLLKVTQARLKRAQPDDFGFARSLWAYRENFGITGGKGDPRLLRKHVRGLQEAFRQADKPEEREKILARTGRLLNGSATLWIGALAEDDYKLTQELAERAARTMRLALLEGVVPGGGTALLACRPALETKLRQASGPDERAAYAILARALEEPFRTLASNAGYSPGQILAALAGLPPGHGFDLQTGKTVDMQAAGLVDAAGVLREAVRSALSSAALLLTTDVLVHLKNPPQSYNT